MNGVVVAVSKTDKDVVYVKVEGLPVGVTKGRGEGGEGRGIKEGEVRGGYTYTEEGSLYYSHTRKTRTT